MAIKMIPFPVCENNF